MSRAVRGPKGGEERVLVELLCRRARGAQVRPDRLSLARYLTDWLLGLPVSVRPSSATRYRGILTVHVIPQLGGVR
jgi:hypothetical protein